MSNALLPSCESSTAADEQGEPPSKRRISDRSLANLRLGKPKQQANGSALRDAIKRILDSHPGGRTLRAKEVCSDLDMAQIGERVYWPSVRTVQWHIREIRRARSESTIAQIVEGEDAMAEHTALFESTASVG